MEMREEIVAGTDAPPDFDGAEVERWCLTALELFDAPVTCAMVLGAVLHRRSQCLRMSGLRVDDAMEFVWQALWRMSKDGRVLQSFLDPPIPVTMRDHDRGFYSLPILDRVARA
jgi:hypothetical protein